MKGFVRLIIAAVLGGTVAVLLPRHGVLSVTQEAIAFLSLLMAGLLPAMILTATILRGDSLSAKQVDEYGAALRLQLRFWSRLFITATVATAGVIVSKIYSDPCAQFAITMKGRLLLDADGVISASVFLAGAGISVIVQRLQAAFQGIVSLLDLNVRMAKVDALENDKARLDALDADAREVASLSPYARHGIKPEI